MRKTVRDWKEEWINTNDVTTYEGSFAQIPKGLLDRKVIKCGKILQSSIDERNGAYTLTI